MWWLFGTLLFIVALPVILLKSPDQKVLESKQIEEGYRKCSQCAELIKKEALVCKHCGANVSETASKNEDTTIT